MLVLDDHTKLSFPSCYFTSSKGASISQWGPKNIFLWEPLAIFYDTSTMSQKFSIQVPVYPDGIPVVGCNDLPIMYQHWQPVVPQ